MNSLTNEPDVMANRYARRLAMTHVPLACCAIESANAVDEWQAHQDTTTAPNTDLPTLNVLVIAGTITTGNEHLVLDAYQHLPDPKTVIAFGVCAISGGPYWDSYAVRPGAHDLVPVDHHVPGCPPRPADLHATLTQIATAS